MRRLLLAASFSLLAGAAIGRPLSYAQRVLPPSRAPGPAVEPFVAINAQRLALVHVRVIDGTGAPALADRTVLIKGGRIVSIGGPELPIPRGSTVLNLAGHSVLPGLIGMHDHLFYIARPDLNAKGHFEPPLLAPQMTFSAPRLYLAAGVTTLRTTGSVEPYTDINLKAQIDAGKLPGPHMDITAPYLEGKSNLFVQMHQLTGPNDARRTVDFWAEEGMTSFKAYMHITRAELGAAIQEAHRLGLKITGHLCAVTYPQAARLGIDDLEHGFFVNTELDPGKKPDQCTPGDGAATLGKMKAGGQAARALIRL
ncbi:MAG: amidohydrolase, partial [Alphaproteobacteria bacterium]|nr:amidohydrolase [Alphaproteobacteria bacterium]